MTDEKGLTQSILVVGGGISGLTAAVEAAEAGRDVFIVEKRPYLGGRVVQLNQYFPKLCPPNCGLEINFRRIRQNPRIKFFTLAEVERISGEEGNFDVTIKLSPRYVNENCTACGACGEVVTTEIPNEYNYNMDKIKGAYLPHDMAYPMRYVIAPEIIGTEEATKAKEAGEREPESGEHCLGHRVESLRCQQDGKSGVWQGPQCDHQRDDGAVGSLRWSHQREDYPPG